MREKIFLPAAHVRKRAHACAHTHTNTHTEIPVLNKKTTESTTEGGSRVQGEISSES